MIDTIDTKLFLLAILTFTEMRANSNTFGVKYSSVFSVSVMSEVSDILLILMSIPFVLLTYMI